MTKAFTIPSVFTAIDKFSGPINKMGNATSAFAAKSRAAFAYAERGFKWMLSPLTAMNKLLMGLGFYVGLYSLVRILRDAVGLMADFQQAQVNISSVTGKTVQQNKALSDQARDLAVRYGEVATNVSKIQYELIKLGGIDVLKTTEAALIGAVGTGLDPEKFSGMIGAITKAYAKNPELAGTPQQIVDKIVKSLDIGALNGDDLMTMIPNALTAAASSKVPLEDLLTMFTLARDVQLQAASASTAMKNMTIINGVKNKEMAEQLKKITNSPNELVKAYKLYKQKSAQTAVALAGGLAGGQWADYVKQIVDSDGYASNRAVKQLESFNGAVKQAKAAYGEFVLSIDDGTGKFSKALTHFAKSSAALFLLASDSDAARSQLSKMDQSVINTAKNWRIWLNIIKWYIIAMVAAKGALIAWNIWLGISRVSMVAWNVVAGLMYGLNLANISALLGGTAAMQGYTAAAWLGRSAMAAFNVVAGVSLATVLAITAAILLAVGAVTIIIKKWNDWGAAVSTLLGPIGSMLSLVQSIRRNWEMLGDAFNVSFLDGIKALGLVIYDSVLMPIQQVFKLLSNLPGETGTNAAKIASIIDTYRSSIGVNTVTDESGNPLEGKGKHTGVMNQIAMDEYASRKASEGRLTVDFKNVPAGVKVEADNGNGGSSDVTPKVTSTHGWKFPFN